MNINSILNYFCVLIFAQFACGQTQTSDTGAKPPNKTEPTKTDYPNLETQAEEISKALYQVYFTKLV
jgi:hypothetical protein